MPVDWTEEALDRLADILVEVDSLQIQDEVERAAGRINAGLAADPWDRGESRDGTDRVWFVHPLMVAFRIYPGRGDVVVYHVAWLGSRRA